MRTKIGMITIILGCMMGDSRSLIIPITVIAIGAALVYAGRKRGEYEDY